MMHLAVRLVKFPDQRIAVEVREENVGGSESSYIFTYYTRQGRRINVSNLRRDYWGEVYGAVEILR